MHNCTCIYHYIKFTLSRVHSNKPFQKFYNKIDAVRTSVTSLHERVCWFYRQLIVQVSSGSEGNVANTLYLYKLVNNTVAFGATSDIHMEDYLPQLCIEGMMHSSDPMRGRYH